MKRNVTESSHATMHPVNFAPKQTCCKCNGTLVDNSESIQKHI